MPDNNRIRESDNRMKELTERYPERFRGLIMPWFTPEGYVKMRAAAVDRDNLRDTFEEFEQAASASFREAVRNGHPVEQVILDVDALIAWCAAEEQPLDGMALQMFAFVTVAERDSRGRHA
jgi:hypothetical protein